MARLQSVSPEQAQGQAKEQLEAVQAKLGMVPNIFKHFANSPAVLDAYLSFSGAMANASLSAGVREQIALTVAGANNCDYCAAAHTAIGQSVGVADEALASSLSGTSADAKVQAALTFAQKLVENRAEVNDADVQAVKDAGFTDGEVAEIVATVAINIFTNYFNHVVRPEIDFPKVALPA